MGGKRRCAACGCAEVRDGTETFTVTLPSSGVVASAVAPVRCCAGCGDARMDGAARARIQLAIGCALADRGVFSGDVLRHMRKALELRAADLAALLDVTPETISHWETGKARASRAAFVAVAAMVEEAMGGRTATRDRLAAIANAPAHPRTVAVKLGPR